MTPRPIPSGTGRLVIGEGAVEYRLFRSERRTLGITVEPGGALRVTAPHEATSDRITEGLRRRRSWIRRRMREVSDQPLPAPTPEWIGGETHRYLGRQYRLKIRRGEPQVLLRGGYFEVASGDRSPSAVRQLLERWYREHATALFERRAAVLIGATPRLRLHQVPPIRVRKMRKRWGSWTPAGNLLLNVEAVKLPLGCVDYLLMHELCHLRVPDHGKRFWRLLEACMPDWERWRERMGQAEV